MKVIYDQAQDLTLILDEKEKKKILERKTKNFYDGEIRGIEKERGLEGELGIEVHLANTLDAKRILYRPTNPLSEAMNMDGMGRIVIPHPEDKNSPWLIGLADTGIDNLISGWQYGVRYNGSNKLFIKVDEFSRD